MTHPLIRKMSRFLIVLTSLLCCWGLVQAEPVKPASRPSAWFTAEEVAPNTWRIDDHGIANVYLVIGTQRALLVDTGAGAADLRGFAQSLTALPLSVINTHGHPDHVGANFQFGAIMAPAADFAAIRQMATPEDLRAHAGMLGGAVVPASDLYNGPVQPLTLTAVKDGDMIDLGGRTLEVIESPGHTPGEIVLLDNRNKLLFAGDNSNTLVWLFLGNCLPLETYLRSLEKVEARAGEFSRVLPGHGGPIEGDFVGEQIACVKGILAGTAASEEYKTFVGDARLSRYQRAAVAFDPNNLRAAK
jgi:glyoxylase-like metal-dependent hydrolase (beta-lactamase superfamily II)